MLGNSHRPRYDVRGNKRKPSGAWCPVANSPPRSMRISMHRAGLTQSAWRIACVRQSALAQIEHEAGGVHRAVFNFLKGLVDLLQSPLFIDHVRSACGVQLERLFQIKSRAND